MPDLAARLDRLERLALVLAQRYGTVGSLANAILEEIQREHGNTEAPRNPEAPRQR